LRTRHQQHDLAARIDPRLTWSGTEPSASPLGPAPRLRHRRDGILPATAAALSVRGQTLTSTGSKADTPPRHHPLVAEFLASLPAEQRERGIGRCPEALLLSRFFEAADTGRSRRAARRPLSHGEARRALKNAKITTRRIHEVGDPRHGTYAPPCRSCAPLLAHFGVRTIEVPLDAVEGA
jgi:hypothetical protein